MQLTRHVRARLTQYCDGQLSAAEALRIEHHLAECPRCRRDVEDVQFASGLMQHLARRDPPPQLWARIDAALDVPRRFDVLTVHRATAGRLAMAAALVVAIAVAPLVLSRSGSGPWLVATDGATAAARMDSGEWIETSSGSRARITVGAIGIVDVEPSSRVRLGDIRGAEHRLSLAVGSISARISAPPRMFFVDTPASTVVDLGCAYTVSVDEAGTGLLRVTEGWAALESGDRESLVPAGARCRIAGGSGPGIPVFEDASAALTDAIARFDAGSRDAGVLDTILAASRRRDTLSLWHLVSRVPEAQRARVVDRIISLTPLPDGVTREDILRLDTAALSRWRDELAWDW